MDEDECQHVDRGDNICAYCYHELNENIGCEDAPLKATTKVKSIWSDLEPLNSIPEEIRRRADEINQEQGFLTHRGKQRKKVVLYCLYTAVKERKYPIEAKQLAQLLGLKASDVASVMALEMRLAIKTKKNPTIQLKTPLEVLPTMAKRVGLGEDDQIASLITLSTQLLADKPEMNQRSPLNVAAALIYYYCVLRFGDDINLGVISERTEVSTSDIQEIYTELV
jgi:transcription initiation factor TFIIIB Brf1 subunit/transcription initiation factor TFIIB